MKKSINILDDITKSVEDYLEKVKKLNEIGDINIGGKGVKPVLQPKILEPKRGPAKSKVEVLMKPPGVEKVNKNTLDYSKINKPKQTPENEQATLTYDNKNTSKAPVYTPPKVTPTPTKPKAQEASPAQSSSRINEQKQKEKLNPPKPPTASETIVTRQAKAKIETKKASDMKKSQLMNTISEDLLTKSMLSIHSRDEITAMLKSAVDGGQIHRNTLLQWQNFGTLDGSIMGLVAEKD